MWLRARVLLKIQKKNLDFWSKKTFFSLFWDLNLSASGIYTSSKCFEFEINFAEDLYGPSTYILNYFIVLWLERIVANIIEMNPRDEWNFPSARIKANRGVTRDDSQRRFLAQHSIVMLEQRWNHSKQCRNAVLRIVLCNITFNQLKKKTVDIFIKNRQTIETLHCRVLILAVSTGWWEVLKRQREGREG